MRVRELMRDLDLLRRPALDLPGLQLDGVPFGAPVERFPRHRITEVTLSPLAANSRSGTHMEPEYYDAASRRLSLDEVIDSVFAASGIVHFPSKLSFKIAGGRVIGFALYGEQLRYFDYLQSYEKFCEAFGPADRVLTHEAYGDLMGYSHFYFRSQKCVQWDAFGSRVSLINLGDYEGNRGEDAGRT